MLAPKHHASAMRNRLPITEKLVEFVRDFNILEGKCLEIGSGTGAHLEAFCEDPRLERFVWQPSEFVPPPARSDAPPRPPSDVWKAYGKISSGEEAGGLAGLSSTSASPAAASSNRAPGELELIDAVGCGKFPTRALPAIHLDLLAPLEELDASIKPNSLALVHVGNVLHVAPPAAIDGLARVAAFALKKPGGLLSIYGPFTINGGAFTTESNREFHNKLVAANPNFGYRDADDVVAKAEARGLRFERSVEMPANNFFLLFSMMSSGDGGEGGGRM
jgi:hypothetical protein